MRRVLKGLGIVAGLLLLLAAWPAWRLWGELSKAASQDPRVWEDDIAALVEATADGPNDHGAVLFVGSSSIRLWSTLHEDMAPLDVVQHGFGGAKLADVEFFADELVTPFAPRGVVVFAGTNDIHPGRTKPPDVLLATWQRFVSRVRAGSPDVPIHFIGITPSLMRWEVWPQAQETNRLIREWNASQPGLSYIETGPALLGADGTPDPDNYVFDGLHLSDRGYAIWTEAIRAHLAEPGALLPPRAAGDG